MLPPSAVQVVRALHFSSKAKRPSLHTRIFSAFSSQAFLPSRVLSQTSPIFAIDVSQFSLLPSTTQASGPRQSKSGVIFPSLQASTCLPSVLQALAPSLLQPSPSPASDVS